MSSRAHAGVDLGVRHITAPQTLFGQLALGSLHHHISEIMTHRDMNGTLAQSLNVLRTIASSIVE